MSTRTKKPFIVSQQTRPQAVMLSKRANVFYLEHVKVIQKDGRIMYLTQTGAELERFFNIPERNTSFVLLGKGTSITDAAMRKMAESNVLVGFCGSGGSPLFGALDITFLPPQSEYRPTEYMQAWMRLWQDDAARLEAGKALLRQRVKITREQWVTYPELLEHRIAIKTELIDGFEKKLGGATSAQALLLAEAYWAKGLYATLAKGFDLSFKRKQGKTERIQTIEDLSNRFMDHGNYIAYGYAAVALCGLGISFAFPLLHGKTRRGGLVFDLADVVKDAFVMPLAFIAAVNHATQQDFRNILIDNSQQSGILDLLLDFVKDVSQQSTINQPLVK